MALRSRYNPVAPAQRLRVMRWLFLKRPAVGKAVTRTVGMRIAKPSKIPRSWCSDWPIIKRLRATKDAPVDTVGCEHLANARSKKDYEWQCLVAAMLSSQTKDQATGAAMNNLSRYGNSILHIANTPEARIDRLISMVGFHATKARHLRMAAKICLKNYKGRVPDTLKGLLALPGVGPKMAHLTLHAAFGRQDGLCVDTHVHRIANALGWLATKSAEETRVALEAWLPRREWKHINVLLVGLGQQQQQTPQVLIDRCLAMRSASLRLSALKILARVGLPLRHGRFPSLDAAADHDGAVRRLLTTQARCLAA